MRDLANVTYPWSPYYKSTLRFLLSEYVLYVTNFVNFSKYSHIQKYKYTGSCCRSKAYRQPEQNTH